MSIEKSFEELNSFEQQKALSFIQTQRKNLASLEGQWFSIFDANGCYMMNGYINSVTVSTVKAPRRNSRRLDPRIDVCATISLNEILKHLRSAGQWLALNFKKAKKPQISLPEPERKLPFFKFLLKQLKCLLKQPKKVLRKFFDFLARRGVFPKNLEELLAWLKAWLQVLKILLSHYLRQLKYLMIFVALFDQFRFRNLKNIIDAYNRGDWQRFFYLVENFLKVPLHMLNISLLTRDPDAGSTALCYALPLLLWADFRIPVLTDFLEKVLSEVFPAEVGPIGTRPAPIARRILERLTSKTFTPLLN